MDFYWVINKGGNINSYQHTYKLINNSIDMS